MTTTTSLNHGPVAGKPTWQSTESYGLLLLFLSSLFNSLMGVFIKFADATGVPSNELVLLRAIFQGSLVVAAMMYLQDETTTDLLIVRPFGNRNVKSVVIARGVVGGIGLLCIFYTLSNLPLGDATALLSLNPIVTVLGAAIFLKEPLLPAYIFSAFASVVGSVLIARPAFLFGTDDAASSISHNPRGYLTAFVGTCSMAAVIILVRKAGKTGVHTLQLLYSWSFFGLLFSSLVVLSGRSRLVSPPSLLSWAYILGVCMAGGMSLFLTNFAGRLAPAGITSIVLSSKIVWAYAWQILIFHQVPSLWTVLGVSLIFASLLTVAFQPKQQQETMDREASSQESDELKLELNDEDTLPHEATPLTSAIRPGNV
jgi:drug/metabolite transporter (DMT)-like permease